MVSAVASTFHRRQLRRQRVATCPATPTMSQTQGRARFEAVYDSRQEGRTGGEGALTCCVLAA